ncbi:molybdate ABC transporter substrate-binding protein [Bradyrhizobium sp.]|uniref:molybdate ABC transporter substrate-binding protein n=1 Tax=Bradyrhizobium sp. TaxID=376 RepID=UPI003C650883
MNNLERNLNILSGGAAQGLVASLAPAFKATTGLDIAGEFGAVGVMADKLRRGAAADIVILTAALLAGLAEEKFVVTASIANVGRVETALAVRSGDPKLSVTTADDLRAALLAADAIFVPDIKASTAGIHVAKVLAQLGIADAVADRLRVHPNGATAMRHLASSDAKRPIGCTQSTEIIATSGVEFSGPLPQGCELATMYTAGVTVHAANATAAERLIELLTSTDARDLRIKAGFASR